MSKIHHIEDHKQQVMDLINSVIYELTSRAWKHDNDKFREPQKSINEKIGYKSLENKDYIFSKEEKEIIKKGNIDHQEKDCNNHHPNKFNATLSDADIFDIVEMICDGIA